MVALTALRRARAVFVAALFLAAGLLVAEFPLAGLVHARTSASTAAAELAAVRAENAALSRQVKALQSPWSPAIAALAHEEYGLVRPGESSVEVLPAHDAVSPDGSGDPSVASLGATTIPHADLVPSDAVLAPEDAGVGEGGSFWHRLVERLEFWNASA